MILFGRKDLGPSLQKILEDFGLSLFNPAAGDSIALTFVTPGHPDIRIISESLEEALDSRFTVFA
jgi:hypothetical protein